ncbi:helix-turn-helix transcriptional regulator [bacterium]|nr:helix-turn-helix transcriptional regulator [bacterium]
MSLKILFGKKLKDLRKERGLTQEKFAELLELETGSIGMIEIGQRATSFETLEKISEKLNINYYELFDFEEIETKNSIEKAIIKEINKLDEKTLKFILNFIKDISKFIN